MKPSNYFTYLTTNFTKKILYTGITNDLYTRLNQHTEDSHGEKKTFVGKYNCIYLIYFERHSDPTDAIEREKEIKGWSRQRKEQLINSVNPQWNFLNDHI